LQREAQLDRTKSKSATDRYLADINSGMTLPDVRVPIP
jgi:hypothetical protein